MAVPSWISIQEPSALAGLGIHPNLPRFNPTWLAQHAPDAHWILPGADGAIAGRCSLWWRSPPPHAGHRVGIIGHYAAADDGIGRQLLTHAGEQLKSHGCTLAIGPMDGNTWRNYRLATESHSEPPFFLEPTNPRDWPEQFTREGFESLANYYSSVDERLEADDDASAQRAGTRLTRLGVTLRAFELANFERELRTIHEVVTQSFRNGFLYQPLPAAEFVAQYEPIRYWVRPDLVTIAMLEERPVGFIFTLPDLLERQTGRCEETAIIKTLAILPERRLAGLGSHLVAANRRAVRAAGYRRLIHALMHESNRSRSISARYASIFRRYTLFAKPL